MQFVFACLIDLGFVELQDIGCRIYECRVEIEMAEVAL
jgi:hypothetical protein